MMSKKLNTKTILTAGVTNLVRPTEQMIASNKPLPKPASLINGSLAKSAILGIRNNQESSLVPVGRNPKFTPRKVPKIRKIENWQRTKRNVSALKIRL